MKFIRKNFYGILYIIAAVVAVGNVVEIRAAVVAMNAETRCVEYGCNNNCEKGSIFCYLHNSDTVEVAMDEPNW